MILLCGAAVDAKIETYDKPLPFSIWFWGSGETHHPTGSAITWKYEAIGESDINPLNNMGIGMNQNYDLFVVHYVLNEGEFSNIESTINSNILTKFSGQVHGGAWYKGDMNTKIKEELFGSSTYQIQPHPSTAGWETLNRVSRDYTEDISISPQTTKDIEAKHVLAVVCMHNGNFPRNNVYCEIAHKYYKIYNCGACTGEVCPLDYVPEEYVESYFARHGEHICFPKGEEVGGMCENVYDCKNLIEMPDYNLGAPANRAYHYIPVRCEKGDEMTGVAEWLQEHSTGGHFGSCELGAVTPSDCAILGDVDDFHLALGPNEFYASMSGWGVHEGKCVLGECSTSSNCYDIYNTIHYECTPLYLDDSMIPSIGVCEQTEWTGPIIQAKCDDLYGAPDPGYGWTVDSEGNCQQYKPFDSQCNINGNGEECGCDEGYVSACVTVVTSEGTIGLCSCEESGLPMTASWCGDGTCDADEDVDGCPEDCLASDDDDVDPRPRKKERDLGMYLLGICAIVCVGALLLLK